MKVAYLASQATLPGASRRRADAIEHDQMIAALKSAFEEHNDLIQDISWDDKTIDWALFDAVIIGSIWDYCDRYTEFLQVVEKISSETSLFNPPELVRWNSNKRYLRDLQNKGVNTVATSWIDNPQQEVDWGTMFRKFDTDKLVVKRQIGANAEGQFILNKGEQAPDVRHPLMVQPYLPAITQEGEYSFIFIDGQLSHTLLKRPAKGDYRIQSSYGGTELLASPSNTEKESAQSVLATLEAVPLYARVDMLRNTDGKLALLELELIEPFLYPLQGPKLGTLLHAALRKRL